MLSLMAASCSHNVGVTTAQANKLLNENKNEEAIMTLYDNLTDEEIADSAINILVPAMANCSKSSMAFKDIKVTDTKISPEATMNSAVISADGRHIVTTESKAQRVKVYSYPAMKLESEINVPEFAYTARLDHTGKNVAVAAHNGNVYVYEFPSGKLAATLNTNDYAVRDLHFTKDGRLFTVSNDCTLSMFEYPSGNRLERIRLHSRNAKDLDFSADEKLICTASNDGSIRVMCYTDGEILNNGEWSYIDLGDNYANAVTFSPDGKTVVGGTGTGFVKFYNTEDETYITSFMLPEPVASLAYNPDGSKLAAGTGSAVYIFDGKTNQFLYKIPKMGEDFWSVQFTDNNHLMAADRTSVYQITLPSTADIVRFGRTIYESYKAADNDKK